MSEKLRGGSEWTALRELAAKWEDYVKGMEAGMPKLSEGSQEIASYQVLMAKRFIADWEALAAAPSEPPAQSDKRSQEWLDGYAFALGQASEEKRKAEREVGEGLREAFQQRVHPWMLACFSPEISADKVERNHRFIEEALELVHSCGTTQSEAHQLVDYVYGRPMGEASQEVGGVMVTLAALCLAQGLDMHASGETELSRIWTKVEQIRVKQAAKPKHSPLAVLAAPAPKPAPPAEPDARFEAHTKAVADFLNELYAIMVDPLLDGPINVAEMQRALLEAAKRDREYSHFINYYNVEATARLALERWRMKPHNAKWWKKIDGTPIPNDLIVCISEDIAVALRRAAERGRE